MNIKSIFPQTENITYLNTAACGLLSQRVLDVKHKNNMMLFNQGSAYFNNEDLIVGHTKQKIADVYHAEVDRIAITPNFSLAFNAVLDGIDSSSTFLCLDEDYLSVRLPIQKKGFKYKSIPITAELEKDIKQWIKQYNPNVLALSMVQFTNGITLETSFFQQLKNDIPNLKILVDATQYLGTAHFDFKTSGIDLLIASGYKWLNAGFGNAIVLMSNDLYRNLSPKQIGSNSILDKTKLDEKPMGFLELGHYDLGAIQSLDAALELHYNTIGIEYISNSINELSGLAFNTFKSCGLLEEKVVLRNVHSNIFNLNISQNRYDEFIESGIYLSKRGTGLRVGFHYHNKIDDLEHLMKLINR